jgi:hypothetical protein
MISHDGSHRDRMVGISFRKVKRKLRYICHHPRHEPQETHSANLLSGSQLRIINDCSFSSILSFAIYPHVDDAPLGLRPLPWGRPFLPGLYFPFL